LVAKVGELVRKFVANVFVDSSRNAYTAWLSQTFHARSNIDAIPVDVAPFDDDVPEIDSGPKFKSPLFSYPDIVLSCGLLHLDGALQRTPGHPPSGPKAKKKKTTDATPPTAQPKAQ